MLPRLYSRNDVLALKRKRLVTEGSAKFTVTITDLIAGAKKLYGFDTDSEIRKYLPLNYLRIQNKGGTILKVYVSQRSDGEVIQKDMIWTHHGDFYTFTLENLDGSTTATGSQIYVDVQRNPGD